MANTYTLTSSAYKGRYMQVVYTQEMDVANNKSTIHWTLSSIGGEVNYYGTGPTSVYINAKCVYYKDRTSADSKVFPAAKGSVSGTIEIDHNEDGTKGTPVLMNTVVYYGSSSVKAYSGWWELDPIPQGAKIQTAPSSFTNASLPTITYTNPLGDKASNLEICIANSAGSVVAPYRALSKTGTSYTFTSLDMVALNNKMAGNGDILDVLFIIRTTTADGRVFEDKKPSTYRMVETTDTEPKVTMVLTPSNPDSVPSALANTYIQGKSGVKATITAEGRYNATISNVEVMADIVGAGSFFTPPTAKATATLTTDAITKSGNVSVIGSATDSREFTGEIQESIFVEPYSKPSIQPIEGETSIRCYRSNGSGKQVGNSTSVWVKVKRSYHSLDGNNLCKLQWRYREAKDAWNNTHQWFNLIARTDTAKDAYSDLLRDANREPIVFELDEPYVIQIRAVDDFVEYSYDDFEIPTQDVALHLGDGGKNVTIGEYCNYAEERTFTSAWKAIFEKGIYGTLTPQLATNVLTYATGCQIGTTPIYTSESSAQLPPNGDFKGASGFVFKMTDTQITVVLFSNSSGSLAINIRNDTIGGWLGWKYIHTSLS